MEMKDCCAVQNPNGISRLGLWQAHETHSFSCDVRNELGLLGEVTGEVLNVLE